MGRVPITYVFVEKQEKYQGPVVQSIVSLELVSGHNVNYSSKYNI